MKCHMLLLFCRSLLDLMSISLSLIKSICKFQKCLLKQEDARFCFILQETFDFVLPDKAFFFQKDLIDCQINSCLSVLDLSVLARSAKELKLAILQILRMPILSEKIYGVFLFFFRLFKEQQLSLSIQDHLIFIQGGLQITLHSQYHMQLQQGLVKGS